MHRGRSPALPAFGVIHRAAFPQESMQMAVPESGTEKWDSPYRPSVCGIGRTGPGPEVMDWNLPGLELSFSETMESSEPQ